MLASARAQLRVVLRAPTVGHKRDLGALFHQKVTELVLVAGLKRCNRALANRIAEKAQTVRLSTRSTQ